MPEPTPARGDDWSIVWNAREKALSDILGKPAEIVFHAVIPFQFPDTGGAADVMPFPNFVPGMTYVTAELTGGDVGQLPNSMGNYELMICVKDDLKVAADIISRLACYTCKAKLEAGQTMDIGTIFGDSTLRAFLFTHPGDGPFHFEFLGKRYGLLLCIAITADELVFGRSQGTEQLLARLKKHNVFPYSIPNRPSIPLSDPSSFFGRMFGR